MDKIPINCIQIRNLILCSIPKKFSEKHPGRPPVAFDDILNVPGIKDKLESFDNTQNPSFTDDFNNIKSRLLELLHDDNYIDINSLSLYNLNLNVHQNNNVVGNLPCPGFRNVLDSDFDDLINNFVKEVANYYQNYHHSSSGDLNSNNPMSPSKLDKLSHEKTNSASLFNLFLIEIFNDLEKKYELDLQGNINRRELPYDRLNLDYIICSPHYKVIHRLLYYLDSSLKFLFINSIINQLTYPNINTLFWYQILNCLFRATLFEEDEDNKNSIHEIIARIMTERLSAHRPHPWGLIVAYDFILIKNLKEEMSRSERRNYMFMKYEAIESLISRASLMCSSH